MALRMSSDDANMFTYNVYINEKAQAMAYNSVLYRLQPGDGRSGDACDASLGVASAGAVHDDVEASITESKRQGTRDD